VAAAPAASSETTSLYVFGKTKRVIARRSINLHLTILYVTVVIILGCRSAAFCVPAA